MPISASWMERFALKRHPPEKVQATHFGLKTQESTRRGRGSSLSGDEGGQGGEDDDSGEHSNYWNLRWINAHQRPALEQPVAERNGVEDSRGEVEEKRR